MDMNNQIMLQQLKKRAGRLHDPNLSGELRPSQPPGGGSEENGQRHSEPGAQARKVDADAASTTAGTSPGSTPRRGIATLATKTATGLPVQGDDVQVSKTSGDAGSEEGGQSPQRKEVLEVRPPQVRLLRVGERDGRHERREEGGRPGRGGGADSGFIPEPKEVEEPEIGGGGSCGREHVSSMQQLVQGLPRIPEASGVSGDRRRRGDLGAAWQRCEGKKGVRWARRAQRGDNPFFVVDKEHYVMVNGEWERAHGNIEPGAKSVYVRASLTPRGQLECEEDRFNDQKLNRSERRRLAKAMRDRSEAVKISELYGPGRIQEAAEDLRMTTSSCFDLLTGWDLSQEAQRKAMWKALREEKPDFLIVSPPCTAFSQIQTTNWARMLPKKRVALLTAGLEHLQLAAAVMKWQLNRGRHILFEQPAGVTSWKEACIQSIAQRPEVHTIVNHQCQFGLNVDDLGPNKKPTRWMSSSQKVLSRLNRRCTGEHQHTPLQNGMPAKAAIYPPELCQAIALGVAEEMEPRECYAVEEEDGPEDGDPEEIHDEEGDGQGAVTEVEKKALLKVHRSVGHPQNQEFIRFLRAARVRGDLIRWVAQEFKCDVCEANQQPKVPRPTALPRAYQPNRVLGVDLFYIPGPGGGNNTKPVLNMLDWGTNYQMCEMLPGKNPNEVWAAYRSTWARTFGHPEVIVCDMGREFMGEFISKAAAEGIVVHQIASKAPWQQGKTERHGGHMKEMITKARSEMVIQTDEDLKLMLAEVEQMKNRYSNRSGFAPVQRQIGQWPRVPTEITADNAIDPTLLDGVLTDDIEKLHEVRRIAHKAFCEYNADSTIKRALRSRPRVWRDFKAGEYVYVYRVPKARKRRHGVPDDQHGTKARWVGPGVIITPDGANV